MHDLPRSEINMKSLELRWIRGFDKDLLLPEVIFVFNPTYSGLYIPPMKKEKLIAGKYYPCDHGLIICSTLNPDIKSTAGTLAHEWRHHWQAYNSSLPCDYVSFDKYMDYKSAIKKYYSSSKRELDALKFEIQMAPTDWSKQWLAWLIGD